VDVVAANSLLGKRGDRMASAETWIVNLVGAGAWVAGGYIAVKYVLPPVRELLADVFKYNKAVNALITLLTIWVYVVVVAGVIERLTAIGEKALSYVTVVNPVLDVLNGFVPYVQWFVVGIGLVVIAERLRLK
jgi:hypothetical protein